MRFHVPTSGIHVLQVLLQLRKLSCEESPAVWVTFGLQHGFVGLPRNFSSDSCFFEASKRAYPKISFLRRF